MGDLMNNRPLQRILFVAGVAIALLGLYGASRTSHAFRWDSFATIVIMAAGVFAAIIGFVNLIHTDEGAAERPAAGERSVLPAGIVPIVFGGFVTGIAVVAALVVGHYAGRNAGWMTFILAFVLSNAVFGLGLWLGRQPSYR